MARGSKITEYHSYTGNERAREFRSDYFPVERETLCGHWDMARRTEDRDRSDTARTMLDATCRACSKAYGKAELKKLGSRITTEKLEGVGRFKTALIVAVDGVRRAVVAFPTGWGGHWEVFEFSEERWNMHVASPKGGFSYGITGTRRSGSIETDFWSTQKVEKLAEQPAWNPRNIHLMSQEAMLSIVPALVDAGKLPTDQERRDAEAARKEAERVRREQYDREAAERQVIRERQAAEAQARRDHAIEALLSIEKQHGGLGGTLNNFDSEGLALALSLLGHKREEGAAAG